MVIMTQEELNSLIEQKYKEIEELESQKEGLVDYHLKDIGEQMVKHKYYILERFNAYMDELLSVTSFTLEKGRLIIHGLTDSTLDSNNEFIENYVYEYCTFHPISKEDYDFLISKLNDFRELRNNLIPEFDKIKNKS